MKEDFGQADEYIVELIQLATAIGTDSTLMSAWGSLEMANALNNRTNAAIYAGKKAIEHQRRLNQKNLNISSKILGANFKDLTFGFDKYHGTLIDLLCEQGRLAEAERVMSIRKEMEFFRFDESKPDTELALLTYTSFEREQDKKLNEIIVNMVGIREEVAHYALNGKDLPDSLNAVFQQKKTILVDDFAKVLLHFSHTTKDDTRQKEDSTEVQRVLKKLDENTVALYTSIHDDSYKVMLVTSIDRKLYSTKIDSRELGKKIAQYRMALQDTTQDPKILGKELFDIIMPVELQNELEKMQKNSTTIVPLMLMWQLDVALRYLPLAALHDGHQYLIQKYRLSSFTTESLETLPDLPNKKWSALGFGVSQGWDVENDHFKPLKNVPGELQTIIQGNTNTGILPGSTYLDENFTWKNMQSILSNKNNKYSVIHISTHFKLEPGSAEKSYLLTGDGKTLSLKTLGDQKNLFKDIDLLTLSACDTAVDSGPAIDGLAYIAQRNGAKSILASLWPVDDQSTSLLMAAFYKLRESKKINKAAALRQAQLALIDGKVDGKIIKQYVQKSSRKNGETDSNLPKYDFDPTREYAHPYYWAPFILIGNWR